MKKKDFKKDEDNDVVPPKSSTSIFLLIFIFLSIGVAFYFYAQQNPSIYSSIAKIMNPSKANNQNPKLKTASTLEKYTKMEFKIVLHPKTSSNDRVFTPEELSKYRNEKDGLYLSIMGHVFDVTSGAKNYGKNGGYYGFTGRDGSKAFITGDFQENNPGLTDDILSLEPTQLLDIYEWLEFYFSSEYIYKGKFEGKFFKKDGSFTEYYEEVLKKVNQGVEIKREDEKEKTDWPGCNSKWTQKDGSELWCGPKSGGVTRNWSGFPRWRFNSQTKAKRCVCVENSNFEDPSLKLIEGCNKNSEKCFIKNEDKNQSNKNENEHHRNGGDHYKKDEL